MADKYSYVYLSHIQFLWRSFLPMRNVYSGLRSRVGFITVRISSNQTVSLFTRFQREVNFLRLRSLFKHLACYVKKRNSSPQTAGKENKGVNFPADFVCNPVSALQTRLDQRQSLNGPVDKGKCCCRSCSPEAGRSVSL